MWLWPIEAAAELRLDVGRTQIVLPADFGVFGFVDAGRVFVDGASPGGWHAGAGAGIWFSFLDHANTLSVALAPVGEFTALYIRSGLAF